MTGAGAKMRWKPHKPGRWRTHAGRVGAELLRESSSTWWIYVVWVSARNTGCVEMARGRRRKKHHARELAEAAVRVLDAQVNAAG